MAALSLQQSATRIFREMSILSAQIATIDANPRITLSLWHTSQQQRRDLRSVASITTWLGPEASEDMPSPSASRTQMSVCSNQGNGTERLTSRWQSLSVHGSTAASTQQRWIASTLRGVPHVAELHPLGTFEIVGKAQEKTRWEFPETRH